MSASKPDFWTWIQYLVNDWQHGDEDYDDVIAFAIRMASWSDNGKEVYRSAKRLALQAGCSIRTAKRRRAKAIELGLFRELGTYRHGVACLEIALPADREPVEGAKSDTPDEAESVADDTGVPNLAREGVKSGTAGVSDLAPNTYSDSYTDTSNEFQDQFGNDWSDDLEDIPELQTTIIGRPYATPAGKPHRFSWTQ